MDPRVSLDSLYSIYINTYPDFCRLELGPVYHSQRDEGGALGHAGRRHYPAAAGREMEDLRSGKYKRLYNVHRGLSYLSAAAFLFSRSSSLNWSMADMRRCIRDYSFSHCT